MKRDAARDVAGHVRVVEHFLTNSTSLGVRRASRATKDVRVCVCVCLVWLWKKRDGMGWCRKGERHGRLKEGKKKWRKVGKEEGKRDR